MSNLTTPVPTILLHPEEKEKEPQKPHHHHKHCHHHKKKHQDHRHHHRHKEKKSTNESTPMSSKSRSSLATDLSLSSTSSSNASLTSMVTGLDIGPSSYNPSNTLPLSAKRSNIKIYSNTSTEKKLKPNNLQLNKNYLQAQAFLSYQNHQNPKINSTILTLGSATMFSSASLLTLPTSSQSQIPYTNKNNLQNGNNVNVPYMPAHQSPLTSHPLINETRTRSLSRAKLKQSSQVSALLSGFALVAMVEMDLNNRSTIPLSVLMFFIITTTLLVSVHMIALMISTCILPHIESMNAMQDLALTLGQNEANKHYTSELTSPSSPLINETKDPSDRFMVESSTYGSAPHQKMRWYISIAWFFSTVIGIFLFILELVAIVWVKFWDHNRNESPEQENAKWISDGKMIATISTLLLIPVLLSLIYFAFHFYRKLVLLRYEMAQKVLDELNLWADGLSGYEHV